jgi:hypothetical protein
VAFYILPSLDSSINIIPRLHFLILAFALSGVTRKAMAMQDAPIKQPSGYTACSTLNSLIQEIEELENMWGSPRMLLQWSNFKRMKAHYFNLCQFVRDYEKIKRKRNNGAAIAGSNTLNEKSGVGSGIDRDQSKAVVTSAAPDVVSIPTKNPFRYIYSPLSEQTFRILVLFPGTGDEEIKFQLLHTHIENPPTYEAISYAWGDGKKKGMLHSIENVANEGRGLSVSQNLHDALKKFRYPSTSRILWADAVCINQHDIEERSSQVAMMSLIYRRCFRVLVWLGNDTRGYSTTAERVITNVALQLCRNASVDEFRLGGMKVFK